ncbi:MAG TPA: RecQ family ATP-dependent DNA helicase [Desulfomicrobiaceae bacterium]|nr:RecQ family ATP-dependent DNA helicase [Desulfomicrobiaceae bacterium]
MSQHPRHTPPLPFPDSGVVLDLEIHPETEALLKLGAIRPSSGRELRFQGSFDPKEAVARLDELCGDATFIAGHNIADHDLPWLRTRFPSARCLSLPVLDTLYLSPLAFPRNPYHRLLKGYKLVRDSVNDPVRDAMQSLDLLRDELRAFHSLPKQVSGFYGLMLERSFSKSVYGPLLRIVTRAEHPPPDAARTIWLQELTERVCPTHAGSVFDRHMADPALSARLAYMLAWLRVAGADSILPAWVWHTFKDIRSTLTLLRATPCGLVDCPYCSRVFDSKAQLKKWFGFDNFLPVRNETPPLQQQIVDSLLAGNDCLAVLPTGAGKSLCYQLPALIQGELRNTLTLIISPLQSLMKDQVDGLVRKGILSGCTINGMLSMLERTQVLESIRLGDRNLIWLAPEQLRNKTVKDVLKQREIGMVVMDEAHCFSKWGHDFRPDYLSLAKFLAEICPPPPMPQPRICCCTATAKQEVVDEILDYFRTKMDRDLSLFEGGHERSNLTYEVVDCPGPDKLDRIHETLQEIFPEPDSPGGGIVFVATRKRAEQFAESLQDRGWECAHYHARLTPDDKKSVQDRFLSGTLRVITATNAFGMGVDKPDVRVVIHADIPGSLENYLQEAGRAGRDRDQALCRLLYDPDDLDTQFQFCTSSELTFRDVRAMYSGLKKISQPRPHRTVVMTSGELLSADEMDDREFDSLDGNENSADTKVRTALSWLEQQGKVDRGDNRTTVIEGRIRAKTRKEAEEKIGRLQLSASTRTLWLSILNELFQAAPNDLLNTDMLSGAVGLDSHQLLKTLHSMREAGIITHDLNMSAFLRKAVSDDSRTRFQDRTGLEEELLRLMEEDEPDGQRNHKYIFPLRHICQRARDRGRSNAVPQQVLAVLDLLAEEKLLRIANHSPSTYGVILRKDWSEIRKAVHIRNTVAARVLNHLLDQIPPGTRGKDLLVSFQTSDLERTLRTDMLTRTIPDLPEKILKTLFALHRMRAIVLQNGLAVIRPAMTIRVTAPDEDVSKNEFVSLETYYKQKVAQVHVMGRYAELGTAPTAGIRTALRFVVDYFSQAGDSFLQTHFKGMFTLLELPTSKDQFERIVKELNPSQRRIVESGTTRNGLVVAGPGSGKTRVIVHRIAYLVKVKRVPPKRILALAFNRNAVLQLRKRLRDLLGRDAARIRVHTYHSLAMSVTGTSLYGRSGPDTGEAVFEDILRQAVTLLRDEQNRDTGSALDWRDRILGLEHILVDEYQDINEIQYELLSLLAGRNEAEQGKKPCLLVVGDADQNIYTFQGSNIRFIRRFQEDYKGTVHHLAENYRSVRQIMDCATTLVEHNTERMAPPEFRCIRAKEAGAPVELLRVRTPEALSKGVLKRAAQLIKTGTDPGSICILCRTNREMHSLQFLAREINLDLQVIRKRNIPLPHVRELRLVMECLILNGKQECTPKEVREMVDAILEWSGFSADNMWVETLRTLARQYEEENGRRTLPVREFAEFVHDVARDESRLLEGNRDRISLCTMHAAKGLEFGTVLLAGQPVFTGSTAEEERRLYYVAMTRAKDRLVCFAPDGRPHPFFKEIAEGPESGRTSDVIIESLSDAERKRVNMTIWEMGLSDVAISFPAWRGRGRAALPLIQNMEPGQRQTLQVRENRDTVEVTTGGKVVCRLSARGVRNFREYIRQGYTVEKVIFLANIHRRRSEDDAYAARETISAWDVPLFQILFRKNAPASNSFF